MSKSQTPSNAEDLAEWNEARSLASDLVKATRDGSKSFSSVRDEWNIELPPYDECVMAVMNADASSRTARINDVARWIRDWGSDNQPEQPQAPRRVYGRN